MASEALPGPIGQSLPRAGAKRLVRGRGRYTDDMALPGMLHAAFHRSPHAHARIVAVDTAAASAAPGVFRVVTGAELATVCRPWTTTHDLYPSLKSPPQHAMAVEKACWQGEPVAAVLAASRAQAEDAAEQIEIDWQPLVAVAEPEAALGTAAPLIHENLKSNLSFETTVEIGELETAFDDAEAIVEESFVFGRHTGVPLEMRAIIADWEAGEGQLTVYQSHQVPHQQQDIYARQLGIAEHRVRVVAPDVGGAFGIKLQLYGDEIAACALSLLVGRPVKYQADRTEAFQSDIHARDHRVRARMALDASGRILAVEVDDLFPIGPYSQYPRCTLNEGMHVIRATGAPYRYAHHRGRLRIVFQNKNMVGHYRAVGQPVATAVTERLVDLGAAEIGLDPVEMRRLNHVSTADGPTRSATGIDFQEAGFDNCLEALLAGVKLDALRQEQARLRRQGIWRGLGLASFVELSAPGPEGYGKAGIRVSTQDGAIVKLEPSGRLRCTPSITEQGQGTDAAVVQIVAAAMGVDVDDVQVTSGDSAQSPYGGGAFASRGITIGGEAAWRASRALRDNVLALAGAILQSEPADLDIRGGMIADASGERMSLAEVAEIATFRQHLLPQGLQPELTVVRHYLPQTGAGNVGIGVQAAHLEVDPMTGFVTLLGHWVAHECATLINPMLAEAQIRGGVVQGLGAALYEECRYDGEGQLLNASLADYLVPMAAEIPEIEILSVPGRPVPDTELGAKGIGELGTAGASAAVLNAINDAILPSGGRIARIPATPERVLAAIDRQPAT
ncbi:MAG: xanthine dehydrogenase family protein molybdopterin-binding subunit [Alphaproteobacteria bacterium]|jgi:carbon-monoxide dehydrogenase large subunit|nr:xanthine dehydrogenase family protein molybdopterin-binding subunit [Alphaproteobacteria bacterium]